MTVDTFPLVDQTSLENLFILTGTDRDGLQQSPFWREYMAKILCNSELEIQNPLMPERKLIQIVPNKISVINEVVKHYMARFYEHNMRLGRLFSEQALENLLYNKFEKIYVSLDTEFPFVLDILFFFELSDDNESNITYFRNYFKNINLVHRRSLVEVNLKSKTNFLANTGS